MNCNIMETSELNKKYEYAKKRVKEERIFYTHLGVYLVINIIITVVILQFQEYIYDGYLVINLISSPVLWGVLHQAVAIVLYGTSLFLLYQFRGVQPAK